MQFCKQFRLQKNKTSINEIRQFFFDDLEIDTAFNKLEFTPVRDIATLKQHINTVLSDN